MLSAKQNVCCKLQDIGHLDNHCNIDTLLFDKGIWLHLGAALCSTPDQATDMGCPEPGIPWKPSRQQWLFSAV